MPKPVIWLFIIFGFLCLLIGFFSHIFILFGILLIGAGIFIGIGPDGVLRKEQVMESWAMLIQNGNGQAEGFFADTVSYIKQNNTPFIETNRQMVSPGLFGALIGNDRDFLIATNTENIRMGPYRIFINARDYGNNLDTAWFLTFKPTVLQAALSIIPFVHLVPKTENDLNLFDQQDLRAYSGIVHQAVLGSVEKIVTGLNQDASKIDRKSRGFLGLS